MIDTHIRLNFAKGILYYITIRTELLKMAAGTKGGVGIPGETGRAEGVDGR